MIAAQNPEYGMSQIDDIKANAEEIHKGLKRVAPSREVSLPVHTTRDLLAELEAKAAKLVEQIESLNQA